MTLAAAAVQALAGAWLGLVLAPSAAKWLWP